MLGGLQGPCRLVELGGELRLALRDTAHLSLVLVGLGTLRGLDSLVRGVLAIAPQVLGPASQPLRRLLAGAHLGAPQPLDLRPELGELPLGLLVGAGLRVGLHLGEGLLDPGV